MNKLTERYTSPPSAASSEARIIGEAAANDAGFDKMLKFKKGDYVCDGDEVPMGTEYIAHTLGWTKAWIKFVDGVPAERRIYRVLKGETPPERVDMPDLDNATWERDPSGRPMDPWSYQYLIPFEAGDGEIVIFVTASFGGRRAVADLCSAWSRKKVKDPGAGMPIIRLRKTTMPSKKWGDIPRPYFEIAGWETSREAIREVKQEAVDAAQKNRDMDDDIPF